MSKKYIAVYGSLREGRHNNKYFDLKKLGTTVIYGWNLYNLGAYPCIVRAEDDCPLTVEVMETDEENFNAIHRMEIGAGYDFKVIDIEVGGNTYQCIIYKYRKTPQHGKLIESGDYNSIFAESTGQHY